MARNATDESWRYLDQRHFVLHDWDKKFCAVFRATLAAGGVKPIQLLASQSEPECFCGGWIRCAKQECLSKLILFGEASLRRALDEFVEHLSYKTESPGLKGSALLFPNDEHTSESIVNTK